MPDPLTSSTISSASDLLTPEELHSVTGATHAGKQAEVLSRAHIFHWWGLDGKLRTTWYHVHAAGATQPQHQSTILPAMDLVR